MSHSSLSRSRSWGLSSLRAAERTPVLFTVFGRALLAAVVTLALTGSASASSSVLFGDQSVESTLDSNTAGLAEAFPFSDATSGNAGSISVYIDARNRARVVTLGLYNSNGSGRPAALLGSGSLSAPQSGTWNTVSIASTSVSAGHTYWLAILSSSGAVYFRDRSAGLCTSVTSSRRNLSSLPSSWTSGATRDACPISAYVGGAPLGSSPVNTGLPVIGGSTVQGQTLSTSNGSWSNSPTGYAYAWQDCDSLGNNCATISGATSNSYILTSNDVGHTIRSVVTASNAGGSTSLASAPTSVVSPQPPVNSSLPVVSGSTAEGQTLTSSTGSWSNSPTSYSYQWQDCSSSGSSCTDITSATSSSYMLQASDVGDTVDVVVTASNAGGAASAASAQTATVTASGGGGGAPVVMGEPVVTGTVATGQTLTTSNGTWSNSPTSYTYQWQHCATDGTSCSNVSGATASTYTVASGDAGHTIEAVVTASNNSGSTSADAPIVPLVDNFGGSTPDTNVWDVLDQQGDTSNSEPECYEPSQVTEGSNQLKETAVYVSAGFTCPAGTPDSNNPLYYNSGAIAETNAFTYGTVDVKAEMAGPAGAEGTTWWAIWLLGASCQPYLFNGTGTGYNCPWSSDASDAAEIDIAEGAGGQVNVGENVYNNSGGANDACTSGTITNTASNFHNYDVVWTAGSLVFKIDGVTQTSCDVTSGVPSHPMFLIIDTAITVNGIFGGTPVPGDLPQTTTVDYVHVSH